MTVLSSEDDSNCGVSLHALKGQLPTGTIKLAGMVNNNQLVILVDSGSTHSFLDPAAARRLNCEVEVINPLNVSVAGGGNIECISKCPRVEWDMARHLCAATMRILPLVGYDMVLGVDLLRRLGPIELDYEEHTITFNTKGEKCMMNGIDKEVSIKMMSGKAVHKLFEKKNKTCFSCFCMVSVVEEKVHTPADHTDLLDILKRFQSVFAITKSLTPMRDCNHEIKLKDGVEPFK